MIISEKKLSEAVTDLSMYDEILFFGDEDDIPAVCNELDNIRIATEFAVPGYLREVAEEAEHDREIFKEHFVPAYLRALSEREAMRSLWHIKNMDFEGKSICIAHETDNPVYTHMSIIIGILQMIGCDVHAKNFTFYHSLWEKYNPAAVESFMRANDTIAYVLKSDEKDIPTEIKDTLDFSMENGCSILVKDDCDINGQIQQYIADKGYKNVTVCSLKGDCITNHGTHLKWSVSNEDKRETARDINMVYDSDVCVINSGTGLNDLLIKTAKKSGKICCQYDDKGLTIYKGEKRYINRTLDSSILADYFPKDERNEYEINFKDAFGANPYYEEMKNKADEAKKNKKGNQ